MMLTSRSRANSKKNKNKNIYLHKKRKRLCNYKNGVNINRYTFMVLATLSTLYWRIMILMVLLFLHGLIPVSLVNTDVLTSGAVSISHLGKNLPLFA